MIPSDLLNRPQSTADAALRPVAPSQEISDKLSDLVPGQRVMAEIQALLPNGTYRAMMAQRNITLALPFSAKPGDSLELEVVESDGKLTLAVLSRQQGEAGKAGGDGVSATFSRTGQLIGNLFTAPREQKSGPVGLLLNGNRPIASAPPATAQDILPLLKQAITQSGMFYESHQAGWVEGRFEKAALLQEPQGKLSPQNQAASANPQNASNAQNAQNMQSSEPNTASAAARQTGALAQNASAEANAKAASAPAANAANAPPSAQLVSPGTLHVVQQQLEALATQQFAWQGQVWPGQNMHWEIEEDAKRQNDKGEPTPGWQTRLHLTLPQLGAVEAKIRVDGKQIHLDLSSALDETQQVMRNAMLDLRQQLDAAGLSMGTVGIGALAAQAGDSEETTAPSAAQPTTQSTTASDGENA